MKAVALLCQIEQATAALYNTVIQTTNGPIQGVPAFNSSPVGNLTQWKDITVFKGIPFAATTGGDNRWRQPQPATPWTSTLYASEFGPVCPVATSSSDYVINEDCLNLNIWTAANATDAMLPVVMWSYPAESTARDALVRDSFEVFENLLRHFSLSRYRTERSLMWK